MPTSLVCTRLSQHGPVLPIVKYWLSSRGEIAAGGTGTSGADGDVGNGGLPLAGAGGETGSEGPSSVRTDTKLRDGLEKTYSWIYDQVSALASSALTSVDRAMTSSGRLMKADGCARHLEASR